jgi:hypothetical protein
MEKKDQPESATDGRSVGLFRTCLALYKRNTLRLSPRFLEQYGQSQLRKMQKAWVRLSYHANQSFDEGTSRSSRAAESALVRSLQRDSLLTTRVQRLKTVPGVGPITALTWALEMGDICAPG